MNQKLIKLYFQIEKEHSAYSENEKKEIENFHCKIIDENKKIEPQNSPRNTALRNFVEQVTLPFIEVCEKEAKEKRGCDPWGIYSFILKTLEDLLGNNLKRAKEIKKEIELRKIVEQIVESEGKKVAE